MASIIKKWLHFVALLAIFCPITLFATTPCQSNQQTWLYTVDTSNQSHIVACLTPSNGAIPWFGFIQPNTSATTVSFDASLGTTQTLTIATDVTSSTLSNAIVGQWMLFTIKEDATGGHTFTQPANFVNWSAINTAANATTTEAGYFDGTYFQVISGGQGSAALGPCATSADIAMANFCGGPVPETSTLGSPYVQGKGEANVALATLFPVTLDGPVVSGQVILAVQDCTAYPSLNCAGMGPAPTDTLGNTYTQIVHQSGGYLGVTVWKAVSIADGNDTVNFNFSAGIVSADASVHVYQNLGTVDTSAGNSGTAGNLTTSITTTGNAEVIIGVSSVVSSTNTSLSQVSPTWNQEPSGTGTYGTYVSTLWHNYYADVAGTASITTYSPTVTGLNGQNDTVLIAFNQTTVPGPTSAPPVFRKTAVPDYPFQLVPLYGTSSSLGGSALGAGACSAATVAVTGALVGNSASATPETYPGDGFYWTAYVSAHNVVTVNVCAAAAGTPTASVYDVRVIP